MAKIDSLELINNGFSNRLDTESLTGDRSLILPNKDGVIATLGDITTVSGEDIGYGTTTPFVPLNPSIGDFWKSPPGSNPYADEWYYCERGGITDWWSAIVHAEATLRDIYVSSPYTFGVNVPIYSGNQIYVEQTTYVFAATGAAHTTSLYWNVYSGYHAGSGSFLYNSSAYLGNSQNMNVNSTRRLESVVGWVIPQTCLRLGIYLAPVGSVRSDFNTVGVNYRIRKPPALGN